MLELIPFSAATYWLNYTAHNATCAGATLGDVARAMAPYLAHVQANREAFERAKALAPLTFDGRPASVPADVLPVLLDGSPIWCAGWLAEGERLAGVADDFLARGQRLTAGEIYKRASVLIAYAEWTMLLSPEKHRVFDRGRELALKAMDLLGERGESVKIPYQGVELDGVFWPAPGGGKRPAAVCFNGLHSSVEWFWQVGLIRELNRRGVSVLAFDCPGSGTARFHLGVHMEPETELYARPAMDLLLARDDVDPGRVAAVGCSFGGYRAVRAAATDPRYKMCLAWGALYGLKPQSDGGAGSSGMNGLDARTMAWFFGASSLEDVVQKLPRFTLESVIKDLACDLAVFHGAADMQVPVAQARQVIAEAVNARSSELHVYTEEDGGEQHCHLDNLGTAMGHMTDRVAALLG